MSEPKFLADSAIEIGLPPEVLIKHGQLESLMRGR